MFKTIFSIVTFVSCIMIGNAQQTEGHISYNVEFSSNDPQAQMQLAMLQGSKMDLYFTEGKSRTEFKVGTMMQTVTITDIKKAEMLTLMSGMMGKNAIQQPIEKTPESAEGTVELIDETKDVAGYPCKKAVITDAEGNKYTMWYTQSFKVSGEGQKYFNGKGVPGFPLEMQISQNGMDIKMTATSFEKLPKKHTFFDMSIPEGYAVMTKEDLEKMMPKN